MIAWKFPAGQNDTVESWPTGILKFLHNIRKNRGDLTAKGSEKAGDTFGNRKQQSIKGPFLPCTPSHIIIAASSH